VPAFEPCEVPNADSRHGPPLEFASCAGPQQRSATATVGQRSLGFARWVACDAGSSSSFCTPPAGTLQKPDLRLTGSITDVRCRTSAPAGCQPGADYDPSPTPGPYSDPGNGASGAQPPCLPASGSDSACLAGADLTEVTRLPGAQVGAQGSRFEGNGVRITDAGNGPGQDEFATLIDVGFPIPIDCLPSSDALLGSACGVNTSANALAPGVVKDAKAAIWQLGQVELEDSGPDGQRGNADDQVLAVQGIVLP
jgi:hypothetical protein